MHFLYVMFSPDAKGLLLAVMGLLPCLPKKKHEFEKHAFWRKIYVKF